MQHLAPSHDPSRPEHLAPLNGLCWLVPSDPSSSLMCREPKPMECVEETELDGDGDRVLTVPVITPRKKWSPINDSWPSSLLFLLSLPILT